MAYQPQPGDILAVHYHQQKFITKAISWVTGSRYTHAATYLGAGQVGEATTHGYRVAPLSNYGPDTADLAWLPFPGDAEQRAAVVAECRFMEYIELRYNFADIAALLLAHLGFKVEPIMSRLRAKDTMFCSQACAAAWEIAKVEFVDKPYWLVTPADLAHLAGAVD